VRSRIAHLRDPLLRPPDSAPRTDAQNACDGLGTVAPCAPESRQCRDPNDVPQPAPTPQKKGGASGTAPSRPNRAVDQRRVLRAALRVAVRAAGRVEAGVAPQSSP
jgi:hypothetical protein